jgi:hypothetical protein
MVGAGSPALVSSICIYQSSSTNTLDLSEVSSAFSRCPSLLSTSVSASSLESADYNIHGAPPFPLRRTQAAQADLAPLKKAIATPDQRDLSEEDVILSSPTLGRVKTIPKEPARTESWTVCWCLPLIFPRF